MQTVKSALMSYSANAHRAYIQPGYQQNLSGSDTDVSTSTENLTAEEKCVLRNGIRQEPQGEETIINDVDMPSMNFMMNKHHVNNPMFGSLSGMPNDSLHTTPEKQLDKNDNLSHYYGQTDNISYSPPKNSSVPSSPTSSQRKFLFNDLQKTPCHSSLQQFPMTTLHGSNFATSNSDLYYPLMETTNFPTTPQEIVNISKSYLDQSEILKHLAKDMIYHQDRQESHSVSPPNYPTIKYITPDHPKYMSSDSYKRHDGLPAYGHCNAVKSPEKYPVSRSHPNLTHIGRSHGSDENWGKLSLATQRSEAHGRVSVGINSENKINQLIDLLSAENTALKNELDLYYKKVSKLQKFEMEIQKVHQAHEDLMRSTEKREKLEQAIRMKLEMKVCRLQELNKEFRDNLESATCHLSNKRPVNEIGDCEVRKELSKREVLIAQLLTQNKEVIAEKEQQEILLQAQRATLQEQRNHIDILDNALTNAQTNVVRLEEENRKKQVYVERVAQLQKALTSLQQSGERRLFMEKKVRSQLEKEVEALRHQKGGKLESPVRKFSSDSNESLKKTVLEYEKKIIGLEAEVSKWEQKCIEENAMRQIAVDAASVPKDAKIAALERTSQESEKLIAQARSEKLKHMDELYAAHRRCAEFECRIKDFESKLAEKDAMIKVLQHHAKSKDVVFQNAVLGRPPRHTRAASTVGITTCTNHATTTGSACFGRSASSTSALLHRRMGSKAEIGASGSLLSISSDSSSITSPSESSPVADSVTGSQKSLDEQLKELDSRLSSKDSIISALRAEKERYPSHFWRV